MSDGMSGWERMLAEQAAELEKLRGFVAEYGALLQAMRSVVEETRRLRDELPAVVDRSTRLRAALTIVRDRIERTVAKDWRDVVAYRGTLSAYMSRVLDETRE